jgi:hypothetical protein
MLFLVDLLPSASQTKRVKGFLAATTSFARTLTVWRRQALIVKMIGLLVRRSSRKRRNPCRVVWNHPLACSLPRGQGRTIDRIKCRLAVEEFAASALWRSRKREGIFDEKGDERHVLFFQCQDDGDIDM